MVVVVVVTKVRPKIQDICKENGFLLFKRGLEKKFIDVSARAVPRASVSDQVSCSSLQARQGGWAEAARLHSQLVDDALDTLEGISWVYVCM